MSQPAWLSAPFIEKALRRSENDDSICIIDCFVKPATNKGDNYTSDMHRVTVEYRHNQGAKAVTEKITIIIKVAPTAEGVHKELVSTYCENFLKNFNCLLFVTNVCINL